MSHAYTFVLIPGWRCYIGSIAREAYKKRSKRRKQNKIYCSSSRGHFYSASYYCRSVTWVGPWTTLPV